MNKIIVIGRLTKDVDLRYYRETAIAKYSIAVNRKFKKAGEPDADFFNVVAFGKAGEFVDKYFRKGQQIAIVGRLQTGSYTNKEGQKVYTTDIIAEEQHFAGDKKEKEVVKEETVMCSKVTLKADILMEKLLSITQMEVVSREHIKMVFAMVLP